MSAFRQDKSKPNGNQKYSKEKVGLMIEDIRSGVKRRAVADKHGVTLRYMALLITKYHSGELQ